MKLDQYFCYNRKIVYTMVGLLLLLFTTSCATKSMLTKGQLVFEENFEDAKGINPKFWSKIPRGTSDWNNFMSQEDSLYAVENGKLVLRGMKNTIAEEDTASFLTGGVYTKDKLFYGFGRWEIRAKLNGAKGAWPAFWLLPQDAPWPKGGEIDIMERLNYDDFVYQTVHTEYTYNLGIKTPEPGGTAVIDPNGYNTYAVEIHPDRIVFFVNGTQTHTYPKIETDKPGQFPFDQYKFYLLLDMQLGGNWVGEINPEDLPLEMYIDQVRFYSFQHIYPEFR